MQPAPPPGPVRCVAGTILPTTRGPCAAGRLAIGDVLVGADGTHHTLRWAGRTVLAPAWLAPRPALWPVHLAAGALGPAMPPHPLMLLPGTPLALPGCAPVAAEWLAVVPGITRPEPDAALDIVDLHLDPPAPGLPGTLAAPEPPPGADDLAAARRLLAAQAAPPGPLQSKLDSVSPTLASGWAADGDGTPVAVELVVDGIRQPPLPASRLRQDLARAGIAEGRAAFRIAIDPPLDPGRAHLVSVRRARDGTELVGSPVLIGAHAPAETLVERVPPDLARAAVEQAVRSLAGRLPPTA